MKKLLSFIMGIWLFAVSPVLPAITDMIFKEPSSISEKKVLDKIKDEFGWRKDLVEQRLEDRTYTETEINKFIEKATNEVIEGQVNEISEKMKPIELTPITIKYFTPEELQLQIIQLSQNEIKVLLIEGIRFEVITPSQLKILLTKLDNIDLSKFILSLEVQDLNKFMRLFEKAYGFAIDQREFYDVWKKKDVKQMTKIIEQTQKKELTFFTAFSNYQNFDSINWNRREAGFDCRQVLIKKISYNWREKFRPNGDIILTIDFGLSSYEIKALLEMIQENRNKIKMIIIPWGSIEANNYENRDIKTYKIVAEYFDKLAYSIREIAPEIPIYLTACLTSETIDAWVKSFQFPYDGIALWNVLSTRGNLKKVYEIVSKYNKNIILSGVMQCNPDKGGWIDFNVAKDKTLQDINKIQEAGFKGVILMTNHGDK